jgi:hypothetical protein
VSSALVTGGAGFVGSHLVESLVSDGWADTVLDDLSTGDAARVPAGPELVAADLGRHTEPRSGPPRRTCEPGRWHTISSMRSAGWGMYTGQDSGRIERPALWRSSTARSSRGARRNSSALESDAGLRAHGRGRRLPLRGVRHTGCVQRCDGCRDLRGGGLGGFSWRRRQPTSPPSACLCAEGS